MENMLWKWRFRMEEFLKDEKGDSNMVAVVVLIIIVLGIGAIFSKSLKGWVEGVMQQLTNFSFG
ncbi:MAG: hypothetical protein HFH13_13475 [Dorea sp.]|nr:hypothetical protein [Dorea sp.]